MSSTEIMLQKAQAKLPKLEATLAKHLAKIAKLEAEGDEYWAEVTRGEASNKAREIEATKQRIAMLTEKLAQEEERKRIPDVLVPFKTDLVAAWDEDDKARRDKILARGLGGTTYKESLLYYDMQALTDEKIHENNEYDAFMLIAKLMNRVAKKGGKITGYRLLYLANGNTWNDGGVAINGYIDCERQAVHVHSIIAGGYNIQRRHVRVLVH